MIYYSDSKSLKESNTYVCMYVYTLCMYVRMQNSANHKYVDRGS